MLALTSNWDVATWCAIRSNTDEVVIVPGLQVVKGRGLRRATAAAACIEGGSGKEMDGCLRVYSVSFRDSAQANLSAEVVFTELAFLVERYGSEAHVCGFNISSGGTRIASARTDGSITVWEPSSTTGAEWTIELSRQLKESSNMIDESPSSSSCACFDYVCVFLSAGHVLNNNLCLIASLRNGKFEVFQKPLGTHCEKFFSLHGDTRTQFNENCRKVHIGPGSVAAASGRGISVHKITSLTYGAWCHWLFSFS